MSDRRNAWHLFVDSLWFVIRFTFFLSCMFWAHGGHNSNFNKEAASTVRGHRTHQFWFSSRSTVESVNKFRCLISQHYHLSVFFLGGLEIEFILNSGGAFDLKVLCEFKFLNNIKCLIYCWLFLKIKLMNCIIFYPAWVLTISTHWWKHKIFTASISTFFSYKCYILVTCYRIYRHN